MGINVTETMKELGITLEWPPQKWTYQVAIAGVRKNDDVKTFEQFVWIS